MRSFREAYRLLQSLVGAVCRLDRSINTIGILLQPEVETEIGPIIFSSSIEGNYSSKIYVKNNLSIFETLYLSVCLNISICFRKNYLLFVIIISF